MTTDESLAQALQNGDSTALNTLVARHYDSLLGYLYRLLHGDRPLAEDMVQESFLRALRGIHHYTYPRPFKAWLYAIATNLARDHFNRVDTRRVAPMPDEDETGAIWFDSAGDESMIAIDELDEVRAVITSLASLPQHQREVLILYFYQDMPLAVIAETLAIPLGTVKSRLSIGVGRLRERMKSGEPNES